MDYEKIAQVGLEIVKNASIVAKNAQVCLQFDSYQQLTILNNNIVSKQDLSPVTVIDFAVQASISIYLQNAFPTIPFR